MDGEGSRRGLERCAAPPSPPTTPATATLATLGEKNKKRDGKGRRFEIPGSDQAALAQGIAIAAGVQFTRELGNLPPNVCNPPTSPQQAQNSPPKSDKVECEVLDDAAMEALGMGSLLAVARGSAQRPRLVVLKYNNGGDAKPYVLVGRASPSTPAAST